MWDMIERMAERIDYFIQKRDEMIEQGVELRRPRKKMRARMRNAFFI